LDLRFNLPGDFFKGILKMIKPLSFPEYYIIEPTNVCNYKRSICPNRLYSKEEQGYTDWALFVRLLSQIKDCAQVIQLYWMGEPMLHPELFEMIKMRKQIT